LGGEPPLAPAEARDRLADDFGFDPECVRNCNGRGCVQRVMTARHRHAELVDLVFDLALPVAEENRKLRLAIEVAEIGETNIGLRVLTISEYAAVLDLAD